MGRGVHVMTQNKHFPVDTWEQLWTARVGCELWRVMCAVQDAWHEMKQGGNGGVDV